MSNDWIHTRRGATLVEGTLPKLARALEGLTAELKRFNDAREAQPPGYLELKQPLCGKSVLMAVVQAEWSSRDSAEGE